MPYKVTLDRGLISANPPLIAIATLKTWEAEGKLELFEADRAKETRSNEINSAAPPSANQSPWGRRGKPPPKRNSPSAITFAQIAAVLFPHRDAHKLDMAQINDVAHLVRHHSLGHSVFVTLNQRDFIDDGKRKRLHAIFKILVMTPEEVVTMLHETEGWDLPKTGRKVR